MLTVVATVTRASLEFFTFIYLFFILMSHVLLADSRREPHQMPFVYSIEHLIVLTHGRRASITCKFAKVQRQQRATSHPCATESHSIAIEMHITFVDNVVFTETYLPKAISMDRLVVASQLCVLVANNIHIPRGGKGFS